MVVMKQSSNLQDEDAIQIGPSCAVVAATLFHLMLI